VIFPKMQMFTRRIHNLTIVKYSPIYTETCKNGDLGV